MLIDTHCHLNFMVKNTFDTPMTEEEIQKVQNFIEEAQARGVSTIITVGTSLIETANCLALAMRYPAVFATAGIHPNDATEQWSREFDEIKKLVLAHKHERIVAIGECGIDRHYPDYNLQRQQDAFKAQIELALEHNLALIVHSRDADDETLACLDEYRHHTLRGVMHCFAGDVPMAHEVISRGFLIGVGGAVTYPKNEKLRAVVKAIGLGSIILETDAPFLPPQSIRGQKNSPAQIRTIAEYIVELLELDIHEAELTTSGNACHLFQLKSPLDT